LYAPREGRHVDTAAFTDLDLHKDSITAADQTASDAATS
jgi:hypothetical protein